LEDPYQHTALLRGWIFILNLCVWDHIAAIVHCW